MDKYPHGNKKNFLLGVINKYQKRKLHKDFFVI